MKLDLTLEINKIGKIADEIGVTSVLKSHELKFDRNPLTVSHPPTQTQIGTHTTREGSQVAAII